jgi:hypothetical protein
MYAESENPIFAPWTPNTGGGPPCLWQFEGHLYSHHWLQPNVDFLNKILTVQRVGDLLASAVQRLAGQPEYDIAKTVLDDFPLCDKILETRCAELPELLRTVQQSTTELSWST